MFHPRFLPLIAVLALLVGAQACSEKLSKKTGLTAQDLYNRGREKQSAKKYKDAVEAYQLFLERFPNSPLAGKVQLGLADSKMDKKEDLEAEVAFDDFLRLYPADDNVAYALYRKGELLARQVPDPGRDQTKTAEAVKAFSLSLEKNPNGPYAPKARVKIGELRNRLAEHEKRIVEHYITRKKYEAAELRARRTLAAYPDTKAVPEIMAFLAVSLEKQKKNEEAAKIRQTISEKFPQAGKK